jgi:hypothetical protein
MSLSVAEASSQPSRCRAVILNNIMAARLSDHFYFAHRASAADTQAIATSVRTHSIIG